MLTDKTIERRVENSSEYVEYYKSLMRFSFKLVHRFNDFWKDILDEYDLNQTEFLILGVVFDNPGLSQQEIVKIVGADKSIVSRNNAKERIFKYVQHNICQLQNKQLLCSHQFGSRKGLVICCINGEIKEHTNNQHKYSQNQSLDHAHSREIT